MPARIDIDKQAIANFCHKWQVAELALFGSVLREDFRPDSDVDVLVTFAPGAEWSLFDHQQMTEELSVILKRPADLISKHGLERSRNAIRRQAILETAQPLYAAAG